MQVPRKFKPRPKLTAVHLSEMPFMNDLPSHRGKELLVRASIRNTMLFEHFGVQQSKTFQEHANRDAKMPVRSGDITNTFQDAIECHELPSICGHRYCFAN